MAVAGAIIGDILGSQYEFDICKNPDGCELFTKLVTFTDDTVLTLAVKYAIDNRIPFVKAFKQIGRKYPDCGYAGMFENWVLSDNEEPYGSWGNGSAMRTSYIGEYYNKLEDVQRVAEECAAVTHNDPEGIKGAVVTATCIWMAKHGKSKQEIYDYVLEQYPEDKYPFSIVKDIEYIKKNYRWDVSCQGSVPVAMRCFYESGSYESFIRNVFRFEGDCDTLCCIGGGVAEEFYGGTGFDNDKILSQYLTEDLFDIYVGV